MREITRNLFISIAVIIVVSCVIAFLVDNKNRRQTTTADVGTHPDSVITKPTVEKKYTPLFDTIIDRGIYKSYFSSTWKEPLFVSYVLYKGGGECSREKYKFKNDCAVPTATAKDYSKSGYDEGHLANAEDFAYNCESDELTFRFYNCVPQKPSLNRGVWHKWENVVRKESQKDSLLVLTGSVFGKKFIGDSVYVPTHCWKVVESLKKRKVTHIIYCSNSDVPVCDTITLRTLYTRIGYELPLR